MSKVLVIDDSDSWFDAVAAECEKAGYSVIRAQHHREALEMQPDEPVSLVMVDLLIAAKAGAGFMRQLRSRPQLKNAPMLLATAGTSPAKAMQAVGGTTAEIISKDSRSLGSLFEKLRALPVAG